MTRFRAICDHLRPLDLRWNADDPPDNRKASDSAACECGVICKEVPRRHWIWNLFE